MTTKRILGTESGQLAWSKVAMPFKGRFVWSLTSALIGMSLTRSKSNKYRCIHTFMDNICSRRIWRNLMNNHPKKDKDPYLLMRWCVLVVFLLTSIAVAIAGICLSFRTDNPVFLTLCIPLLIAMLRCLFPRPRR